MKRLAGMNLMEDNIFKNIKETCCVIFDDLRKYNNRKVVTLYGDMLSPIIYKPYNHTFELEFTYIDAIDSLYGYHTLKCDYDLILSGDYDDALKKFLQICESAYKTLYVEDYI